MYSKLTITDGTERIMFLAPKGKPGFNIESWRPGIAEYKGGGTWQDSPIADGRQLAYTQWSNVVESWGFKAYDNDADDLVRRMQDLKRLLIKAVQYWTTSWQTEPVWIEAVSPCETYTRYALIRWWALPEEEFPYGGVFYQPQGGAAMDNLTLMLEHLHWTDTIPGVGTATQISGQQTFCYPWYLVCDGDTQSVNCGSDAGLDDLPDFAVAGKGKITVEAWVRADDWGEGIATQAGHIACKGAVNVSGWSFFIGSGLGLRAQVVCAAQIADSYCGTDEFTADGEWHHVLFTYDETGAGTPAARTVYLAIDGVWVTSYAVQQVSIGNYTSDAALSLFLANSSGGTRGWDGGIGWVRVWSFVRYNPAGGNFPPDPRCVFPIPPALTVGLWIREGSGTAIDNAEGTAARDGTAANDAWDCDCDYTFGRSATTSEDEVFVANKHNQAQLTHIFIYTAGSPTPWGTDAANYVTDDTHVLVRGPAGSALYYGIDTSTVNSGPFCSLVFDNSIASGYTTVWEYWNGAWVALAVQDNTNADGAGTGQPLDTTGVRSVHWVQPSDWVPVDLITAVGAGSPGITGYWVRLRTTVAAGGIARQQNRPVYTITWPYVDVDEAQVPGDIPALLRARVRNQSDKDLGNNPPELWASGVLVGLRSIERGADFTAYLNAADEQNPDGIAVAAPPAWSAFASDVQSPTGRIVRCTNIPAYAGTDFAVTWTISNTFAQQYYGRYHAFLRAYQTSGAVGDVSLALWILMASTGVSYFTPYVDFPNTDDFSVVDLGQITLPPTDVVVPAESSVIGIRLIADGNGVVDMDVYDLILLPVDEWAGDFRDPGTTSSTALGNRSDTSAVGTQTNTLLDIDSIVFPRVAIRATQRLVYNNDGVSSVYKPIANGDAILQTDKDQRLWFFMVAGDGTDLTAPFEIVNSLEAQRQARYLSLRGAR